MPPAPSFLRHLVGSSFLVVSWPAASSCPPSRSPWLPPVLLEHISMELPESVKQALQEPACGGMPLLHPHARLPVSWRGLQVGNHFPQDLESIALFSLALSVSLEKVQFCR